MLKYRIRSGSIADFSRWFFAGIPVGFIIIALI